MGVMMIVGVTVVTKDEVVGVVVVNMKKEKITKQFA